MTADSCRMASPPSLKFTKDSTILSLSPPTPGSLAPGQQPSSTGGGVNSHTMMGGSTGQTVGMGVPGQSVGMPGQVMAGQPMAVGMPGQIMPGQMMAQGGRGYGRGFGRGLQPQPYGRGRGGY